jgi:hypothetical protein
VSEDLKVSRRFIPFCVMAALRPPSRMFPTWVFKLTQLGIAELLRIHVFSCCNAVKTWMPATSAGMTAECVEAHCATSRN